MSSQFSALIRPTLRAHLANAAAASSPREFGHTGICCRAAVLVRDAVSLRDARFLCATLRFFARRSVSLRDAPFLCATLRFFARRFFARRSVSLRDVPFLCPTLRFFARRRFAGESGRVGRASAASLPEKRGELAGEARNWPDERGKLAGQPCGPRAQMSGPYATPQR
jgi:hypothetical protein